MINIPITICAFLLTCHACISQNIPLGFYKQKKNDVLGINIIDHKNITYTYNAGLYGNIRYRGEYMAENKKTTAFLVLDIDSSWVYSSSVHILKLSKPSSDSIDLNILFLSESMNTLDTVPPSLVDIKLFNNHHRAFEGQKNGKYRIPVDYKHAIYGKTTSLIYKPIEFNFLPTHNCTIIIKCGQKEAIEERIILKMRYKKNKKMLLMSRPHKWGWYWSSET